MLRFSIIVLNLLGVALVSTSSSTSAQEVPQKNIAITQITKHPSLDLIVQGILSELKKNQYDKAYISQDNAQGDIPTAVQIARKIASQSPDVVVAISTPSAQTMQKALQGRNIPLVFGAVTDPVGAKLIKNLDRPEAFITGTIDLPPVEQQILLIQEMVPHLKSVGLIYNPSEPNSVFQIELFKKELAQKKIKFIEAVAPKTSLVQAAAAYLSNKVEAILIPNDNTVASALQSLLKVTMEAGIPLFASDPESVKEGALAAVANDQEGIGRETGKLVVRLLKGEDPRSIPVQVVNIAKVYVNQETKRKLNF
jgi:putative ABC transport system substrate-binding protein